MIKVGIIGATGYTGVELLRLLVSHPEVEIIEITSRANEGTRVDALFPSLRGHLDLLFTTPDTQRLCACDLVFFATPNGVAMQSAEALVAAGVKVIDLAADFRLKDIATWEQWYGMQHACPDLVQEAVYGLPEVNREHIRQARVVANPGCYPTAVTLGLLPLVQHQLIDLQQIIADCKSGASGAGRKADIGLLLCETSENFKAYAASAHRHTPEITQNLQLAAGTDIDLTFVPHLLPMIRGIHATLYTNLITEDKSQTLQALYEDTYQHEPFVDVMPWGSHPETRSVKGGNTCRMALHQPGDGKRVLVLSVIDNLVKGAAGQAVHNMNLMFDWPETTGLQQAAFLP